MIPVTGTFPESGKQCPPILQISDEVIQLILSYLPLNDLKATALTCTRFSKETIRLIKAPIEPLYNQHLISAATTIELLPAMQIVLPLMCTITPIKKIVYSRLLYLTSSRIFIDLKNGNTIPLTQANALALDGITPWDKLTSNNCGHITHIELNCNWLEQKLPEDIISKLLTCFPNLESCSFKLVATLNNRNTPLHLLVAKKLTQLAKLTITGGADIAAKNNNGETPLHYAAFYGNTQIAKTLINTGADVHTQNNEGETPRDVAIRGRNPDMAWLLEQAEASKGRRNAFSCKIQ